MTWYDGSLLVLHHNLPRPIGFAWICPSFRPWAPFKARCVNAAVKPELRTAHSTGTTPSQKRSSLVGRGRSSGSEWPNSTVSSLGREEKRTTKDALHWNCTKQHLQNHTTILPYQSPKQNFHRGVKKAHGLTKETPTPWQQIIHWSGSFLRQEKGWEEQEKQSEALHHWLPSAWKQLGFRLPVMAGNVMVNCGPVVKCSWE